MNSNSMKNNDLTKQPTTFANKKGNSFLLKLIGYRKSILMLTAFAILAGYATFSGFNSVSASENQNSVKRAASAKAIRALSPMMPPGVPQPGTQLYFENFENRPDPTIAQSLSSYTGAAAALNQTYTANAYWLNGSVCNGYVVSNTNITNFSICTARAMVGRLANAMGQFHGMSATAADSESVLAAYTNFTSGGNNLTQFETNNFITLPGSGSRFVTFGVDTVQTSCPGDPNGSGGTFSGTRPARYNFYLVSTGGVETLLNSSPINACNSTTFIQLTPGGQYFRPLSILASSPILTTSGTQVKLRMRNAEGSATGNDGVVDNFKLVDVSPTLDKSFNPTAVLVGGTSTLTFTITNTDDLLQKNGWSFTDNLPTNLVVAATPNASTTCGTGTTVTANAGATSISVTGGNLVANASSCTVTLDVTSNTAATYSNGSSNITSNVGLNPPATPATVQFGVPDLTITKTAGSSFVRGSNGTYNFSVGNAGVVSTVGTITVTDTLPTGLRVNNGTAASVTLSGANAANWGCNSNASTPQTITCTSSNVIAAGGSSSFSFDVNVGATTPIGTNSITNTATVSGGGQTNTSNDSSSVTSSVSIPNVTCSTIFSSSGSSTNFSIYTVNPATGTGTPIGTLAAATNAIGVQPSTGNIFYYDNVSGNTQLYSWNVTTGVNTAIGSPILSSSGSILRMAFDSTGRLFAANGGNVLFEINPTTGAVISSGTISFTPAPTGSGDMVFGENGVLFYSAGNQFYSVDVTTRNAVLLSTLTASPMVGLAFNSSGTLLGVANFNNSIYSINPNTGVATLIGPAGYAGASDLGTCSFPAPSLASSKSVAKVAGSSGATILPGDTLEYTITVTNNGSAPATGTKLTDAIPAGTTYVASSTSMNGTAIADVSGAMPFVTASLINGVAMNPGVVGSDAGINNVSTIVFRVTVNGGSSPPTSVTNQGTVTYDNGTPVLTDDPSVPGTTDPTVSTITILPPSVTLLKSCSAPANCTSAPQLPGTDLTYNIQFTNGGGSPAANMIVVDKIPDETDYKLGTAAFTAPSGITMVIEYSNDYDALNPTAATWTYTPVSGGGGASAGYDRNVKAIRWVASGTLSNLSPNNVGSVSFVTKIR